MALALQNMPLFDLDIRICPSQEEIIVATESGLDITSIRLSQKQQNRFVWSNGVGTTTTTTSSSSSSAEVETLSCAVVTISMNVRITRRWLDIIRPTNGSGSRMSSKPQALFTPHYHKPKVPSWWLLLVDLSQPSGELVALKKIGNVGESGLDTLLQVPVRLLPAMNSISQNIDTTHSSSSSSSLCSRNYGLYFICDGIFGLDTELSFQMQC